MLYRNPGSRPMLIFRRLRLVAFGLWFTGSLCAAKPVKVIVVAGQSNAVGYNHTREYRKGAAPFPGDLLEQPDVLFWNSGHGEPEWGPLRVDPTGSFGPEIAMAHHLRHRYPDHRVAIIKCAKGGTGIARSRDYDDVVPALNPFDDKGIHWHPPADGQPAGVLYRKLIDNVRAAVAELSRRELEWTLDGMVWMQGEHEAGVSPGMAADYGDLLHRFLISVRRDLRHPGLPVVIGGINGHGWAFRDPVREGQLQVAENTPRVALVETADLSRAGSGGPAHFDADGMLKLGERFARALAGRSRRSRCPH